MSDSKRPLKVFLCHAHADRDPVRGLYTRLTQDGVDAWLDKAKLLPGQDWELEIRKAVRDADVVVVCLSKQFNQVGFRQKEVRLALDTAMEKPEGEIFIIPARLEECDNLESLRKWHWVDLFEEDGYEILMRALRVRGDRIGLTLSAQKNTFYNELERTQKRPSAVIRQNLQTSSGLTIDKTSAKKSSLLERHYFSNIRKITMSITAALGKPQKSEVLIFSVLVAIVVLVLVMLLKELTPLFYSVVRTDTPTVMAAPTLSSNSIPAFIGTSYMLTDTNGKSCQPPVGWIPITVQLGDTPSTLSSSYQMPTDVLLNANCLLTDALLVGSVLYVPPPSATNIEGCVQGAAGWIKSYITQSGDTIYSIAKKYYTTTVLLKNVNCRASDMLYSGEILWIPNVATSTPYLPLTETALPFTVTVFK